MKVLVFGAKGQLGTELCNKLKSENVQFFATDHSEVDITCLQSVKGAVLEYKPTHVINCAAYTQVDQCEEKEELAYAVNAIGARNAAIAAEMCSATLIHISTDFVFDGEKKAPYYEFDKVNPLSVYGKTKLAGEDLVKQFCSKFFIIRTSWLYGHHGANFVKTMLRLSETRSELSVVHDQIGAPTYVNDLIEGLMLLIDSEKYGVYHYSNEGACSWNEFAQKIFDLTGRSVTVNEITSEEFGAPAIRPNYSVMKKFMFKQEFGYTAPEWERSLAVYLEKENLLKEGL